MIASFMSSPFMSISAYSFRGISTTEMNSCASVFL